VKPSTLAWAGGGAVAALLLASLGWGLSHPAERAPLTLVGRPAPDLVVSSLDGGSVRLSDMRGRPLVLNFWASWCPPCREEDPALKAAAMQQAGRVQFVGVDIQDRAAAARDYAEQQRQPYPVGPLSTGSYADYGVTAPPETFFIDSDGTVVARFVGPLDAATLAAYLRKLK
jgi:cytochrome c biogenesis protein CcmG/thiol:disulfide interchange protein DsbE